MHLARPRILTLNGGSSSIKFTLFEVGEPLFQVLECEIERIGLLQSMLILNPGEIFCGQ